MASFQGQGPGLDEDEEGAEHWGLLCSGCRGTVTSSTVSCELDEPFLLAAFDRLVQKQEKKHTVLCDA